MKDGGLFCFAGLLERWRVPGGLALTGSLAELREGDVLETCTILTTHANDEVARVHDRMPAILPPAAFESWLAGDDVALEPWRAGDLTLRPVSPLVNKATNDDPRCIEPVA